ncbi:MAG: TetR/AcrR family transcriptional regulator [Acidobacteria bacterium]|nr:TetR/AcrR family transcriptional regulator [Acidobacteriota bacterium]
MTRRPSSRDAILAAAVAEFAAHGFRGATVDAIARRARLNKAMIYYHFDDKLALYLEILRGIFSVMRDRSAAIVASSTTPREKIAAFIDALGSEADARPHLPRLMMREIADDARRLDPPTLRIMAGVFQNLRAILDEGFEKGAFRRVNPMVAYFQIVAPTLFFRAAAPLREAMSRQGLAELRMEASAFSENLKDSALQALAAGRPEAGTRAAKPRRAPEAPAPKARSATTGDRP